MENTEILDGLISYWTERAHSYSDQNIGELNDWRCDAWRSLILENAPKKDRLRILDIGTGPGFFAIALALAGHEVSAVDVTAHMIRHAQENAHAYGASLKFYLNRGEFLSFEDGSYDLVVSRNVTWNLEYPDKALYEWARVLSPGGRMVYFDANWYLYLFDEELRIKRDAVRKKFLEIHPDFKASGNMSPRRVRDLEQIALSLPLSKQRRPAWDCDILEKIGMSVVNIIENIGMNVTDPSLWDYDTATPMFMVCAEKGEL